jgi:cold shock protein
MAAPAGPSRLMRPS